MFSPLDFRRIKHIYLVSSFLQSKDWMRFVFISAKTGTVMRAYTRAIREISTKHMDLIIEGIAIDARNAMRI